MFIFICLGDPSISDSVISLSFFPVFINRKDNNSISNYQSEEFLYEPVIIYSNADTMKESIIKDNIRKAGIYRWRNNITGDTYIGSSINLSNRLRLYYRYDVISDSTKGNSIINSALLKYGYSNFSLEILEYCDKEEVLKREQYYLDSLKPEYNILKIAGSNSGHKQREESILKRINTFMENKKVKPAKGEPLVHESLKAADTLKDTKENSIIQSPLKGSKRPAEVIELMRKNH